MAPSTPKSAADTDRRFMELALRLAHRMLGRTAPNPAVGAVIADEATGEVIARGWTQQGGRPHAEGHALARAGAQARGRTMYVTLEPCSHHGRTPPCADAIAAAGIRRVVCAIGDPDPEIAGAGLRRAARCRCRRGPRAVRRGGALDGGRPYPAHDQGPAVRAAQDRSIRRWPDRARRRRAPLGHGAGGPPGTRTFCAPVPMQSSSVARPWPTTTPSSPAACRASSGVRRIASSTPNFRTAPDARMFATVARVPVTIFGAVGSKAPQYPKGVEVRRMPALGNGRLSLEVVLESLAAEGLTRVLVEGGPTIAGAFLAADLVDEVVIGHGTEKLGAIGRKPADSHGLEFLDDPERWRTVDERMIGADRLTVHRRMGRFASEPIL